jgi:citrate lyase beta subunit
MSIAPLFVPGHVERSRAKVLELNINDVLLDLEDAVPPSEKEHARRGAISLIRSMPGRVSVRINPHKLSVDFGAACGPEDLAAVVVPGLRGIKMPKAESASAVRLVDEDLRKRERAASLPEDSILLGVIIETTTGIANLAEIAHVGLKRRMHLSFGMGDFTTDLGVEWTRDEAETIVPRSLVPIMSSAAGLLKPSDSAFVDVNDLEGLRASAMRGKSLGYGSKAAIHPKQVDVIKQVYRPTAKEVAWSKRVVEAGAANVEIGKGAFLLDGRMIDDPIIVRARAVLELDAEFGGNDG